MSRRRLAACRDRVDKGLQGPVARGLGLILHRRRGAIEPWSQVRTCRNVCGFDCADGAAARLLSPQPSAAAGTGRAGQGDRGNGRSAEAEGTVDQGSVARDRDVGADPGVNPASSTCL